MRLLMVVSFARDCQAVGADDDGAIGGKAAAGVALQGGAVRERVPALPKAPCPVPLPVSHVPTKTVAPLMARLPLKLLAVSVR